MTIDASRYAIGQRGYFNLPAQNFDYGQQMCLTFAFMLNGNANLGTLNVYVLLDSTVQRLIWTSASSAINSNWQQVYVDILSFDGLQNYKTFQVFFEAVRVTNLISTINMDNIAIYKSFCSALK